MARSKPLRYTWIFSLLVCVVGLAGCSSDKTTLPDKPTAKPGPGGLAAQGAANGGDAAKPPATKDGQPSEADKTPQGGNATLPPITVD